MRCGTRLRWAIDAPNIGAEMVAARMAWAFTRYSSDYVRQERAAIVAQRRPEKGSNQ